MLSIECRIPELEIKLDERAGLKAAGDTIAAGMKRRVQSGSDESGGALAEPKDHKNPPLQRSGQLLSSIAVEVRANGAIWAGPTGARNRRLAAILVHPGKKSTRAAYHVFGLTDELKAEALREYEKALNIDVGSSRFTTVGNR